MPVWGLFGSFLHINCAPSQSRIGAHKSIWEIFVSIPILYLFQVDHNHQVYICSIFLGFLGIFQIDPKTFDILVNLVILDKISWTKLFIISK